MGRKKEEAGLPSRRRRRKEEGGGRPPQDKEKEEEEGGECPQTRHITAPGSAAVTLATPATPQPRTWRRTDCSDICSHQMMKLLKTKKNILDKPPISILR